jgi:hypothetical protein
LFFNLNSFLLSSKPFVTIRTEITSLCELLQKKFRPFNKLWAWILC